MIPAFTGGKPSAMALIPSQLSTRLLGRFLAGEKYEARSLLGSYWVALAIGKPIGIGMGGGAALFFSPAFLRLFFAFLFLFFSFSSPFLLLFSSFSLDFKAKKSIRKV